jgi:hypothetical protein
MKAITDLLTYEDASDIEYEKLKGDHESIEQYHNYSRLSLPQRIDQFRKFLGTFMKKPQED